MSPVFAHIGMPKSGSKAFQRFIGENQHALQQAGIARPNPKTADRWDRNIFEGKGLDRLERVQSQTAGQQAVLITYEGGYIAPDEVIGKLARIGQLKPLMFLRDAVSWTNSFLNQLVKAHRVPWDEIERFSIDDALTVRWLDIEGHLARWRGFCQSDADILVVPYHYAISHADVLQRWTGCAAADAPAAANPNPAADVWSLQVLCGVKKRLAGEGTDDLFRAIDIAQRHLRPRWIDTRSATSPALLSPQEQDNLRNRYETPYAEILRRYGPAGRAGSLAFQPLQGEFVSKDALLHLDAAGHEMVERILADWSEPDGAAVKG
jgi:hypothetical protein